MSKGESFLDRLLARFRRTDSAVVAPATLEQSIASAGSRLRAALERAHSHASDILEALDLEIARRSTGGAEPDVDFCSDAAALLGECVRTQYGGVWDEDPLHGVVLSQVGGLPIARFLPEQAIARSVARRGSWSLSKLASSLASRIEAERKLPAFELAAGASVDQSVAALRGYWKRAFVIELPLSLIGVRELDRFLRSHYYLTTLTEEFLCASGMFVGEVARGLFGGEWRKGASPEELALEFPELSLLPIGRILRLMTEQPEGEPLDEYIRIIPQARLELRGK